MLIYKTMKCADSKYITIGVEDQSRFAYDFTDFESIPTASDYTLISIGFHPSIFDAYNDIVMFWTELPNCLVHTDPNNMGHCSQVLKHIHKIKKIFTNCSFSADYFNKLYNFDKFQFCFTPIHTKHIPQHYSASEKIYDVYYTGNFPCVISKAMPTITKFNNCIVSYTHGTHRNVSYKEKMNLNALSKISIVHGLLLWPDPNTRNYYPGHQAFSQLDKHPLVPQIKTRILEAAASKSVMLCFKDPWNAIESHFQPDKDFIYWTNLNDLEEKIQYIISHYDEFQPMIDHAYKVLISNFTTEKFFYRYLQNI